MKKYGRKYGKQTLAVVLASQLALGATLAGAPAAYAEPEPFGDSFEINKIGEYVVGSNEDGGVAEIVKFNKDNGKFYLVNGATNPPSLDIVTLGNGQGELIKERSVMVKTLAEKEGFVFGDLTSVDVNTETNRIYVAVQAEGAMDNGKILALDYEGNLVAEYGAGVQPDMIKSTPDGRYVMTADEAEPRLGFTAGEGLQDAPGSVTIVDTTTGFSKQVYFEDEDVIDDDVHIRDTLQPDGKIITGKGPKSHAYLDFEPEYISLSGDNSKAYVTLQENNAIATINISSKSVDSVKSLGFKDHSVAGNELDLRKDDEVLLENAPFRGVYMPDGMASYTVGGSTYLFTANEGDATEWEGLENISDIADVKGSLDPESDAYEFLQANGEDFDEVEVLTDRGNDGIYLFGGRSFSIWNANTLDQVYDSGSDFEAITGQRLPEYFNVSNDKAKMDARSTKKGPEPEDIKVGTVGNKALAFIGLERVGGVMTYDVTNPAEPQFMNYTNTRDFTEINEDELNLDTDTGPEGIEFIPATDSPTGLPLLLVAFEVGGRVGVYELGVTKVTLNNKTLSLTAGSSASQLSATVVPMDEGAATTVTWSSSDATVASVDANGNVKPLKAGKTVVTAISADGYGSAEATVTVSNPGVYIPVDPTPTPTPTPSPTPTATPEPTATPTPEAPEFSDVNGHWASEPINKLAGKNILEGMPNGDFEPDSQMTRAQYMAVLYRVLGLEDSASSQGFDDVADDAWYSTYVNALTEAGIATGFPDGSVQPDKAMTREEAFVLLYRAMKDSLPESSESVPAFVDVADVSDWAQEAIDALAAAGILEGTPDGKLNPLGTITRAEIAKIVAAFVE